MYEYYYYYYYYDMTPSKVTVEKSDPESKKGKLRAKFASLTSLPQHQGPNYQFAQSTQTPLISMEEDDTPTWPPLHNACKTGNMNLVRKTLSTNPSLCPHNPPPTSPYTCSNCLTYLLHSRIRRQSTAYLCLHLGHSSRPSHRSQDYIDPMAMSQSRCL